MRSRASRLAELVSPRRARIWQLQKRVERLEAEVQEVRRFSRRLAELTDIVEEVLVPAADRDDERLRRVLDDYARRL